MFGGKKRKQRLEEAGVNAPAQVMSVNDTGMTINNNPRIALVLQVNPMDGSPPFQVSKKVTVSRVSIPRPGDGLAIRYDPSDHDNCEFIEATPDMAAAAGGAPVGDENPFLDQASAGQIATAAAAEPGAVQRGSAAELLATGQRMTAIVREFSPTGQTVGQVDPTKPDPNDPLYVFKVEMPTGGGSPIEATFIHRVPEAKVSTLALGEQLGVAVNPANPTREVAIDWAGSPVA
jgi:hypothetical protein